VIRPKLDDLMPGMPVV